MRPSDFNPKNGLLQLSFSNGTAFSIDLNKSYHREESFYVDLFWEESQQSISLSLALHPKAGDLFLDSCTLEWPLIAGFPEEVLMQGFSNPAKNKWSNLREATPTLSFLERLAAARINAYEPLPHPSLKKASYQAISLRNNQFTLEAKSTDESAALTVFSISNDGSKLIAENQSSGYQLRHSFPAFELQFTTSRKRATATKEVGKSVFSAGITPNCISKGKLEALSQSAFFAEENLRSVVLQEHEATCPAGGGFDVSLFSTFAKTCLASQVLAGISLNPFVVPANTTTKGLKTEKEARFKRWSPSLKKYVYPVNLSDEDSMRTCEQHLLRFYHLGYRYFILNDIAASLRESIDTATTGQQLNKRLDMLKRVLPQATIVLDDLCASDVLLGFQGFRSNPPLRSELPWLARMAGLGKASLKTNKANPFLLAHTEYVTLKIGELSEIHKIIDLSEHAFESSTWLGLETTIGTDDYPTSAVGVR